MIANLSHFPLVSILVPTYNRISFLENCLNSIFSQTYPNWEAILVDDGSKDGTRKFLTSLSDPRIRAFYLEENLGVVHALNVGLDNCSGKYIARLDSDDIFLPRHLEIMINFMEKHKETVLVGSQIIISENSSFRISKDPSGENQGEIFMNSNCINNSTAVFRREIQRDNRLTYHESMCEDFDFGPGL